jgi:hypothetical protein
MVMLAPSHRQYAQPSLTSSALGHPAAYPSGGLSRGNHQQRRCLSSRHEGCQHRLIPLPRNRLEATVFHLGAPFLGPCSGNR